MGSKLAIDGRCGARNRDGTFCARFPLRDKRRCHRHGGRAGRPATHGMYSQRYRRLSEEGNARIDALVRDPDLLDLRRPVAVLQFLLEELMTDLGDDGDPSPAARRARQERLTACITLADRLSRRQEGIYRQALVQQTIRDEMVPLMAKAGQMLDELITKHVAPEKRAEFKNAFRRVAQATVAEAATIA